MTGKSNRVALEYMSAWDASWSNDKPVWNQNKYIPCVLWWVPKVKRTPRKTLKNAIKRGVKWPTQNRNTASRSKLPKPSIGIRIFLFNVADTKSIWPSRGLLKRLNAHLVHQVQPINVALQRLVQRDWSVLESAKCICIFVQVAWNMSDPRKNLESSHERKVMGQDLWHANCHGDSFCRSGICCTIVSALMASDRAPCARQRPMNAKRQSKLGQKFPYSDALLHIRTNRCASAYQNQPSSSIHGLRPMKFWIGTRLFDHQQMSLDHPSLPTPKMPLHRQWQRLAILEGIS